MAKKPYTVIVLLFLIVSFGWFAEAKKELSEKEKIAQLDVHYQEWLDIVHYLIFSEEKTIFLNLTNNRDRDAFINLFWKQRDPSKGTPENEFRDEHIKRFNHANRYFKHGSTLPGWKTDRGKIYIILGPPLSVNEVIKTGLRPVLIWDYMGGPEHGLPTAFNVVFYRKGGFGDYQFYIPSVDGPEKLLDPIAGKSIDPTNYTAIYNEIHDLDPAVANVSLSLIPGEYNRDLSPSLQAPLMMMRIYDVPKNSVSDNYAKGFLNYKGYVDVSVSLQYIDSKFQHYVFKDPLLNMYFVHFALKPERVSVAHSTEQDKFYYNYRLTPIIKKGDDIIFQYSKDYSFYYSKEELDTVIGNGIVIADYFPLIEGSYKLVILLQNSVNEEISYFEKELNIPVSQAIPRLFGPILSYQIEKAPQTIYAAFNIMGYTIKPEVDLVFGQDESIQLFYCVYSGDYRQPVHIAGDIYEITDFSKPKQSFVEPFPAEKHDWMFLRNIDKLNYGDYVLKIRVLGDKKAILDIHEVSFAVSPRNTIAHPPTIAKVLGADNHYVFYLMQAQQFQNSKNNEKALEFFEKAYQLNPVNPALIKSYAEFLLSVKRYELVLKIIESLKNTEKYQIEYFTFSGKAHYYLQNYPTAIECLQQSAKLYNRDFSVLNVLGLSFLQLGQKQESVAALEASLNVFADQPEIKKLIKQIKQEIQP
jgi:GWxTD domain-containing protein